MTDSDLRVVGFVVGGGQRVDSAELRGYAGLLDNQAAHFTTIEAHARGEGGDTSGFTGLLELLVPVVDGVVGLYSETLQFANEKMTELREGLESAAEDYDEREQAAVDDAEKISDDVEGVQA